MVENTPQRHNMVVCTLCSCYPWEMLGLPPVWYKASPIAPRGRGPARRARRFRRQPAKDMEIRVWDLTAETRFLVLPMRPAGTEGWSEEQLADLVTRDSHDRHRLCQDTGSAVVNGVHDMGGMDGFGKVEPELNEPVFHEKWESQRARHGTRDGRPAPLTSTPRASIARHSPRTSICRAPITRNGFWAEEMLIEKGLYLEGGSRRRPRDAAGQGTQARQAGTTTDVERTMVRGKFARPAPGTGEIQESVTRSVRRTSIRRPTRGCRATCADMSASSSWNLAVTCFPKLAAMELGENPQWLYTVVFDGRDLWGADGDPTLKVSIDAFEPYLEPA